MLSLKVMDDFIHTLYSIIDIIIELIVQANFQVSL